MLKLPEIDRIRRYLAIPAFVLVVSLFLPYVDVIIASISGFEFIADGGRGLFLLVGAVGMVAGSLLPKPAAKFDAPYQWVYLGGSAAATFYFLSYFFSFGDLSRRGYSMPWDEFGIGLWLGLIAALAGVVLTFTYKKLK